MLLVIPAHADVIGYVSDSKFHPLAISDGGSLVEADSARLELKGQLRDAFRASHAVLSITAQEDYEDAFDDKHGRLGVVTGKSHDDPFYLMKGGSEPLKSEAPSQELKLQFYEFFSKDKWGRNFAESAVAMENDGSIHILYATDLNADGRKELWMTYRLMHGELGRMVWEQKTDAVWASLANHCFNCD